jgi:hypothetical protein
VLTVDLLGFTDGHVDCAVLEEGGVFWNGVDYEVTFGGLFAVGDKALGVGYGR